MAITFNSTTPAPPDGGNNITWQNDASGNLSGYYSKRKVTFTPVGGVLTIDASICDVAYVNVNAAITSSSITNPADGQELTILWAQDGTGHAVALPTNLLGALTVTTTANKHTCQSFSFNVGDTNWYAIGVNNQ